MAINPDKSTASDSQKLSSSQTELQSVLGLWSAIMIVTGGVIGSGIFFIPDSVANHLHGNLSIILTLWVICGIVNLCGALSLAELSAMMPQTGGMYIFLRETYGRWCSFTWSWTEFWVIRSSAIAAMAVGITLALHEMFELCGHHISQEDWRVYEKVIASGVILLIATINIVGVRWGAAVQNFTTVIKVAFIILLSSLPFLFSGNQTTNPTETQLFDSNQTLISAVVMSIVGIMWAYDGWGNVTVIAHEIKNPKRTIPLALTIGLIVLILLYVGANFAYLQIVGTTSSYEGDNVAAAFGAGLSTLFADGDAVVGANMMLILVIFSVFGALNQIIMTGPRVFYAMAQDHRLFSSLKHVDPRTKTPIIAIATICAWSIFLVLIGDLYQDPSNDKKRLFDLLVNYCIFGGSIFYFLAILAVIILRKKKPHVPRSYKTIGYPLTPVIFLLFYLILLGSMIYNSKFQSLIGLSFVFSGFIVYLLSERAQKKSQQS